ncbi:MAG: hypothetical protein R2809_08690 [Flavobacteriales bacterium]
MTDFTLQDLVNFSRNEKKMVEDVLPELSSAEEIGPSDKTLQFIMDYSKALSVRKSKNLNHISMILN